MLMAPTFFKNFLHCQVGGQDLVFTLSLIDASGNYRYEASGGKNFSFQPNGTQAANTQTGSNCYNLSFQTLTAMGLTFD